MLYIYTISIYFNEARIYNNYKHLHALWQTSKIYEAKMTELKEEIDSSTVTVDFNTWPSIIEQQTEDKRNGELKPRMDHLPLTDMSQSSARSQRNMQSSQGHMGHFQLRPNISHKLSLKRF